ncbi:MAG: NAD(P)/FAD-dependent oxidoreductase [Actinomycetota bacterium]
MERPVVVIGGGIVGTAVAHQLQLSGVSTVVVERDIDPQGASAFSFASLSSFDEVQRDVYLLKSHGMTGWRGWANLYGDDLGLRFPGEIRWAGSSEGARFLMRVAQLAESRGYPVRFICAEEVKLLEPASDLGGTMAATYAPDDGQVDPLRAIARLMTAFSEQGGERRVGRAVLQVEESGITVRVGDDQIEAATVIVAAGAETAALLERLGWDVPIDPSPAFFALPKRSRLS